jgi:hypothetical protein
MGNGTSVIDYHLLFMANLDSTPRRLEYSNLIHHPSRFPIRLAAAHAALLLCHYSAGQIGTQQDGRLSFLSDVGRMLQCHYTKLPRHGPAGFEPRLS